MHDLDRTQMGGVAPEAYRPMPRGTVLNEDEQAGLAAELMEVTSEEEFEDFLGDLISGAAKTIGGFINSPTGEALGGVLKGAAKQLLPVAGTALGGYLGGPAGAQIGKSNRICRFRHVRNGNGGAGVGSCQYLRETGGRCSN